MIEWVRSELEIYAMLMSNKKKIWLIPLGFFLFCALVKWFLSSYYDNYMLMHANDIFSPIVVMVYENKLHKIDKIALFGSLSIFILMYRKARKNY